MRRKIIFSPPLLAADIVAYFFRIYGLAGFSALLLPNAPSG
jgi:hypothetical protein